MPEYDFTITGGGYECKAFKPTNPVLPSLGYGGHPIGSRPKRKALTVYQGRQPFQLEVPMVLFNEGKSVEAMREALENMATTEAELLTQAPPVVQIDAIFKLPIPPSLGTQKTAKWWIEDLKWGEEFRQKPSDGGNMTWKEVTLTLLEWTPDFLLDQYTLTNATRIGKYRVKKPPDTMKSIAAKFHTSVEVLKKLNPKLRSDGSLKNGKVISVPEPKKAPGTKGPKAPSKSPKAKSGKAGGTAPLA